MKKHVIILLALLMLTWILMPASRKIQFSHISIEQGLSQSTVLCIFQDQNGFMWFGTSDGLNRYDGNNINIYQVIPNDPNSLSDNMVRDICGDKSGNLWIATNNGVNKLDPTTGKFIRYKNIPGDPNSLSGNVVRDLYIDDSGILWIGNLYEGLDKFDPKTGAFKNYRGTPEAEIQYLHSICEDNSGCLWVASNKLFKFDPKTEKFTIYENIPGNPNSLADSTLQTLYFDKRSEILWIGTFSAGLDKFDPNTGTFTHYQHDPDNPNSLINNSVRAIWLDRENTLWLGTSHGLSKFDMRHEIFTCYRQDPSDPNSLSNNFIASIYEGRSGALWFGARGGGVNLYNRKLNKFLCYQYDPKNPEGLQDNNVWSFAEDDSGAIWIATENKGLHKFDPENETFTNYRHDPNDPNSLSNDTVIAICKSRTGKFWLGTLAGLNEFDPKTGKVVRYPRESTQARLIFSLYEDREGILWSTTSLGLYKYDPRKKKPSSFLPASEDDYALDNEIRTIFEDRSGWLWLGTRGGGLYQFERKKEKFIKFDDKEYNTERMDYPVSSIYEDHEGLLWIGTNGGGIQKIDRAKKTITVYTTKNGLPNNIINGILEDDQYNMWISTTKGLSRFTRSTNVFRNYGQKSGLQSYEFNAGSYYKSSTGEIYFGGTKGFNRFFPSKVVDNMFIPPVVITSFKIADRSLDQNGELPLQKEVHLGDKVELSYAENIFSIEFAALDYTAPDKNQYKCMLEGFNDDWINLGSKNDITFTNLDPGPYTFKVMGSNNDGYWNSKGASLRIIITPPFWETLYFRGLMVLLLLGMLLGLHKLRTKRIKQDLEKTRLEKELRLKSDFTAMLVHDLRSPLTAIIGYSDMLNEMPDQMDVKKTGQVIHRSSEKMLALINDMLELSKFEAGKMGLEKKEVDIAGTVMEIVEIMSPLFKKRNIELVCDFQPAAKETNLSIDVEKIGQVITNFLSNAAKFTPRQGNVTIKAFKTNSDFVKVSVTDNGPGIPPDKQEFLFDKYVQFSKGKKTKGTGLGLAVSKMIIEAHGGKIGYEPAEGGNGSTFYFSLPIAQSI